MPTPDPNAQLRSALTTFLWRVCAKAAAPETKSADASKGPRHPYIRLINREAERLVKAIREATREEVRVLPGRAQKGAVDAAVRKVTPKVAKALRV